MFRPQPLCCYRGWGSGCITAEASHREALGLNHAGCRALFSSTCFQYSGLYFISSRALIRSLTSNFPVKCAKYARIEQKNRVSWPSNIAQPHIHLPSYFWEEFDDKNKLGRFSLCKTNRRHNILISCLESVARNASVLAYSCLSIGAKIDGFKKSRFKNEILFESNPWSLSFAAKKNANSGKDDSSKNVRWLNLVSPRKGLTAHS